MEIAYDPEANFVAPGEVIAQRVYILNRGNQTAENVQVTFTMPVGTSVWGGYFHPLGTPASGTQSNGEEVVFELGDLPVGAVRTITAPIQVSNDVPVGGQIEWMVDTNYTSPSAATTTIVDAGNLQVALTADKQALEPGEEFLVTLHFANPGETGVARAELTGTIADSLEVLWSSLPAGSLNGQEFTVPLGTLPGQTVQQYVFKLRLSNDTATPMLHPFTASVGGRVDSEFGGATLHLLGLETVPARTTVTPDWAYLLTTHNFTGIRLQGATLISHVPKNASIWGGYPRPLANAPQSGTQNAGDPGFRWELPDIFTGEPHFVQLPFESVDAVYARVQRNELIAGQLVLPADAPFVRGSHRGGELSLQMLAPEPVGPGDEFLLEIRYGNPSDSNTDGARIYLHLPIEGEVIGTSATLTDLGNGLQAMDPGILRPGETGTFWVRMRSPGVAPATWQLDFSAWIADASFPAKTSAARLNIQWAEAFPLSLKLSSPKQLLTDNALFLATLEITNTDPFPLTDVEVTLSAPANLSFWNGYAYPLATGGGGGTIDFPEPVSWTFPSLATGETQVISLPWVLDEVPGWWHTLNTVVTTTEGFSARSRSLVTANSESDLSLFVQADQSTIAPGESVWLTVTTTNAGGESALNPTLSIVLPEGFSYLGSETEPVQTSPFLRYNLSSMNPGDRSRIRLQVAVSDDLPAGQHPSVFAQVRDQSLPANAAMAELSVTLADANPLQLQVTGHGDPASGGVRQVEALLTNTSDDLIEDLTVWLHVPDHNSLDPDHVEPMGGTGGAISAGRPYSYTLDALRPGEPFLLTLPFDTGTPAAGSISPLLVQARSADGLYARDVEHLAFSTGSLRSEMVPGSAFARPGQALDYTIFVGNTSGEERESVVLRASIPKGASFVSASGGGALVGQSVLWDVGTIPSGSVAYVTYTVVADGGLPVGTLLQNEAYVSDSESPRNTSRAVTSIPVGLGTPPLSLLVDYDHPDLTYSLTNNTGQELASLTFWYTMPGGVRLADNSSASGRVPIIWDLLNVVSDVPQDLVSSLLFNGLNPGSIAPLAAAARSNQGFGVVRRHAIPFTDNLYAVSSDGLSPELRAMWADAERFDGGWVRSTWYGWFLDRDWPWIIHAEHSYQFPIRTDFGLYVFDFFLNTWIFVNQSLYFADPNFAIMQVFEDPDWLVMGFYRGGVAPNRWFYHYGEAYDRPMNESELRPLLQPEDD